MSTVSKQVLDSRGVIEGVYLSCKIECGGCDRMLHRHEELPGEAARTGNTTQRVDYHQKMQTESLLAEAVSRGWKLREVGEWRCLHCQASEQDPR